MMAGGWPLPWKRTLLGRYNSPCTLSPPAVHQETACAVDSSDAGTFSVVLRRHTRGLAWLSSGTVIRRAGSVGDAAIQASTARLGDRAGCSRYVYSASPAWCSVALPCCRS